MADFDVDGDADIAVGNFGSNLGLVLDKYEQAVGGMRSVLDAGVELRG